MAIFYQIVYTGGMSFKTGMQYARQNFDILETEISEARGSKSSIADRLGVSLNEDGTLMASQSTPVDWKTTGYTASQVDSDTFKITDPTSDLTDIFTPGRAIRFNNDDTPVYAIIKSSSYASSETTVDVFTSNVPATISQLDIGIVHLGDKGSFVPVEPVSSKPTSWDAKYANRLLLALDTGLLWFGNPITSSFHVIGGNMLYKDWSNSSAKGGTGVTVTQTGGSVVTRLDFNTQYKLSGRLTSLVVAGENRSAITCNDFDIKVYTKAPTGTWATDVKYCVFEMYGLNGVLKPYGFINNALNIAVVNEDDTYNDSLWVEIVNNTSGDSSVFDIEAIIEQAVEG